MTAAAIANPGMSSWAAFKERAKLKAGETVLINGATGSAGRLAVQIAKHFGAKRVIATGRNPEALRALAALGADATIALGDDEAALEDRFRAQFAEGIDVVVDYLWGSSAERLLVAAAKGLQEGASLRFVQVGSISGPNITLPSAVLRSKAIALMGSGLGSVPRDRLAADIGELLQAAATRGFAIPVRAVPVVGSRAGVGRRRERRAHRVHDRRALAVKINRSAPPSTAGFDLSWTFRRPRRDGRSWPIADWRV